LLLTRARRMGTARGICACSSRRRDCWYGDPWHYTTGKDEDANTDGQAKPTHQNIIRLAPPLVITEAEIDSALNIIKEAMEELPSLKGKKEEEVLPPGEKNVHIGIEN
jgi:adenosylmethionine-8-amino-7-oxononanoate aminotransferase